MEQEREYQTVYIKDLFFAILYRWKVIIVAMLVGALAMYGFNALTADNLPAKKITGEEQTQREQIKQVLEDTDIRIETQRIYLSTSPLMSIDPNNFYQANLTLYIQTEYKIQPGLTYQDPDYVPAILAAYQQILSDGDVLAKLAEETNLPAQYLHELITVNAITSHPGILSITINAADEETASTLLQMLKIEMVAAEPSIESLTDKEHTLIAQDHAPILCADTNIADLQKAAFQRLTTLQDQKIEWQKQQTALSFSGSEANVVLLIAVGAIAAILIVVVLVCICHITTSKIYSARTLKNQTGLRILGCISSHRKKDPVVRWFRKLEGRCINPDQIQVVTAMIANFCNKQDQVLIMSQGNQQIQEQLVAQLNASGIQASLCGSPLSDAAAVRAIPDCDAVVMLEQCNVSRYSQVEQTAEIIRDHDKTLLGCVVLDG